MPQEKEERNKEFIAAWKEEGLSNEALGKKFNLSPGGVKGLKARLRKKNPNLYTGKQTSKPAIQQVSKQEKKRPAKEVYDTATYYIDKETKKKIKILAAEQDREISEIVRQILSDYFNKH